jgi:hypothetical protein
VKISKVIGIAIAGPPSGLSGFQFNPPDRCGKETDRDEIRAG